MQHSDVILKRLLSLHPKRIDLSLGRIESLLAHIGHPERQLPPVIHVAGTNGKGSVSAYCRSILEAAGKRVHVYTSPHLVHFHERIRLAGSNGSAHVGEAELAEALEYCEHANGGAPITFFEITTAAAFVLFARHPADYLVLEVGLGGRLDATNVVAASAVGVITQIALDHPEFLGTTIGEVAREKAGILRREVPCIVSAQQDEALAVIRAEAERIGALLLVSGEEWQAIEQHGRMVFQDEDGLLDLALPKLPGRHQIENAGTALRALRALERHRLDPAVVDAGLGNVDWPGRMQRLGPGRLRDDLPDAAELWLDGGHNPAAGAALAMAMSELEERVSRPLVLVVGMIGSKDAGGFLRAFAGLASQVITLAIPGEENALPANELAAIAREAGMAAQAAGSLEEALKQAGESAVVPRILICGSLYLAGHVLAAHGEES